MFFLKKFCLWLFIKGLDSLYYDKCFGQTVKFYYNDGVTFIW